MNREQAITTLRAHEQEPCQLGVLHALLFGSVARNENSPSSDIDIMIEIDPDAQIGIFEYAGIKRMIAELFEEPVDVVNRETLKSFVRPLAEADAVHVF